MPAQTADLWERAHRARDKLSGELLYHPDVELIDIGYELDAEGRIKSTEQIFVRVHVRRSLTREDLGLPAAIHDVPVCIIIADYSLE